MAGVADSLFSSNKLQNAYEDLLHIIPEISYTKAITMALSGQDRFSAIEQGAPIKEIKGYAEKAMQYLDSLLESRDFADRCAIHAVKPLRQRRSRVLGRMNGAAKALLTDYEFVLNERIRELAEQRLGKAFSTSDEAKRALREQNPVVRQLALELLMEERPFVRVNGEDVRFDEAETHAFACVRPDFAEELDLLERWSEERELETRKALELLREDAVTMRYHPALMRALETWGYSPNAAGDRGPDGQGFHAGIVHFFEYRIIGEKDWRFFRKDGRYKPANELSLLAFVEFTQNLRRLLEDPDPDVYPDEIEASALIEDDLGQRRLFIFTCFGECINAFARPAKPLQVITIYPMDGKGFLNAVQKELTPPPGEKRLNLLSPQRRLVSTKGTPRQVGG